MWQIGLIGVCALLGTCVSPAQESSAPPVRQFFNAEGTPVSRIWFLLNKVGFTFRSEADARKRLDVNEEEEGALFYDEVGVRKQLKVMIRVTLENGPPVESAMTKEHEIRRFTVLCDLAEGGEEAGSFERRLDDFTVLKRKDAVHRLEAFEFRGVTFTPAVRYFPLQDLAGPGYMVRMEGVWFDLNYAQ